MKFLKPIFFLLLFCLSLSVLSQDQIIDSLEVALKTTKSDTEKVNILNNLSGKHLELSNTDTALFYAKKALDLSQNISFKKGLLISCANLGVIYQSMSDFSEALKYFEEEFEQYQYVPNKKKEAKNQNNIGNVYADKGDYPKALEFYFKALRTFEDIKFKEGIASTYNNIGIIYTYQNNFDKTLEFFLKALKINEEIQRKKGIVNCLGNIGNVYYLQHKYTQALEYHFRALKLNTAIENKYGLSDNYGNIGTVYNDQSDLDFVKQGLKPSERFDLSIKYSLKALELNEELKNQYGISANLINIGSAYLKQKKYSDAEYYFLKSLTISKGNAYMELTKEIAQKLSETYEKKSDSKKALEYFKIYISARDSLLNEENTKKSVRLEMNFEFDKKEAATKLEQEKKEAIASAESRKQKIIIWSVLGILLLVVGFALFAYRSYRQKQKANIEITKQKEIIEEKQKEILDSIHYAKRIQQALLPTEKYIGKNLKN